VKHLEHPTYELWEERRRWFQQVEEDARGQGSYLVSEQASALAADVQAAFCAGAWVAVVILAIAVVDAALRETEVSGFRGNTQQMLNEAAANQGLQLLRKRRNALVHVDPEKPGLTVDHQWDNRVELEREARRTIEPMFEAFYISPSV
jgi:hypothetical protein